MLIDLVSHTPAGVHQAFDSERTRTTSGSIPNIVRRAATGINCEPPVQVHNVVCELQCTGSSSSSVRSSASGKGVSNELKLPRLRAQATTSCLPDSRRRLPMQFFTSGAEFQPHLDDHMEFYNHRWPHRSMQGLALMISYDVDSILRPVPGSSRLKAYNH